MSRTHFWPVIGLIVIASMLLVSCQPPVQTLVTVVAGTPVVKTEVITATPPPPAKPKRPKRRPRQLWRRRCLDAGSGPGPGRELDHRDRGIIRRPDPAG